jgi:hypothetical protein
MNVHKQIKTMTTFPLILKQGHLFLEIDGHLWLFDTGAPTSFGLGNLALEGLEFRLSPSYMGLTIAQLAQFTGVDCRGLVGADVLGKFDHLIDVPSGTVAISKTSLDHIGVSLPLTDFMGIPILTARIAGNDYRMFLDTGAQISYFQEDSIADFPSAGTITDFLPGAGQFQTDTHQVPMSLGGVSITLRCGTLPGLLGGALMMAGVSGIVGNQLCVGRVTGYFPRRRALVL